MVELNSFDEFRSTTHLTQHDIIANCACDDRCLFLSDKHLEHELFDMSFRVMLSNGTRCFAFPNPTEHHVEWLEWVL